MKKFLIYFFSIWLIMYLLSLVIPSSPNVITYRTINIINSSKNTISIDILKDNGIKQIKPIIPGGNYGLIYIYNSNKNGLIENFNINGKYDYKDYIVKQLGKMKVGVPKRFDNIITTFNSNNYIFKETFFPLYYEDMTQYQHITLEIFDEEYIHYNENIKDYAGTGAGDIYDDE